MIKKLMYEQRLRAERRREYAYSQKGDPNQTLRVVGVPLRIHADLSAHQAIESGAALMPCPAAPSVKVDRFDGRNLLDTLGDSDPLTGATARPKEEDPSLPFERYRDLIDADRRQVSEISRLSEIEEWWESVFERPKRPNAPSSAPPAAAIGHDYGAGSTAGVTQLTPVAASSVSGSSHQSAQYENEKELDKNWSKLPEREKDWLGQVARPYGVNHYVTLLREALRRASSHDDPLDATQRRQLSRDDRKRMRRLLKERARAGDGASSTAFHGFGEDESGSSDSDDSGSDDGERRHNNGFVIEIAGTAASMPSAPVPAAPAPAVRPPAPVVRPPPPRPAQAPEPPKKLSAMEMLKLRTRQALNASSTLPSRLK